MTPRQFAMEVVRKLKAANFQALWAGGCVRDQLLGFRPKDYDVATNARPEEIRELFGKNVEHIVSGVTKLSSLPYHSAKARQAESLRKMLLAMADDIRVIIIKLADRLHNMRTLGFHNAGKKKKIARETLDIYAPIAARLGIYWIKNELEETSFKYFQPDDYANIQSLVSKSEVEREIFIGRVKSLIGSKTSSSETRPRIRSANDSITSSPSFRAKVSIPRIVPQSTSLIMTS